MLESRTHSLRVDLVGEGALLAGLEDNSRSTGVQCYDGSVSSAHKHSGGGESAPHR